MSSLSAVTPEIIIPVFIPIQPVPTIEIPTIDPQSITDFSIDWVNIVNNKIISAFFTLTVTVNIEVVITEDMTTSVVIDDSHSSSLTPSGGSCLSNLESCSDNGLTFCFRIKPTSFVENSYIFSSGADQDDGYGITIMYRFGKLQYVVATQSEVWYAESEALPLNQWSTLCISWQQNYGLEIIINNIIVARTTIPIVREVTITTTSVNDYYIGTTTSVTTTQFYCVFHLEIIRIYYAQWIILITSGKLEGE